MRTYHEPVSIHSAFEEFGVLHAHAADQPNAPTGLAFEIADLMLLQGWADFHGVQMVVELDHCVEGEEYEEVVAF